jgi:hypothetical protein
MKQYGKLLLATVVLVGSVSWATTSYIDDNLMSWTRGDAGSTWQEWTFDDADNPAAPESFFNPYGSPLASFQGTNGGSHGSVDFGWKASWSGREGVWSGNVLTADVYIPNDPAGNPYKIIWFEMEYQAVAVLQSPTVVLGANYQIEQFYYDPGTNIDDWKTMVVGWKIWPNPTEETIRFELWGTGGFVNSVSIDTICVIPEPATLVILGLGVVVLVKRKRS